MKTTDGVELKKNSYYYLENGQVVTLVDWMLTGEEMRYLVIPFYEGEGMNVSGDGGYHHEYNFNYEVEGLETITKTLFDSEPLEKIGERYSRAERELRELNNVISIQKESTKKLETDKFRLTNEINTCSKFFETEKGLLETLKKDIDKLQETLSEKRSELSNLEDSINNLTDAPKSEELARLRKVDFKMDCLEAGGLDNWEWYGESLKVFEERYPN